MFSTPSRFHDVLLAAPAQQDPGQEPESTNTDESVTETFESAADRFVSSAVDLAPRLAAAVIIIVLAWLIGRLVRMGLRRVMCRRHTESFARVMSKIGSWLVIGLGVAAAVSVAFPSVKPVDLLAGLGFFSVAIGFAFQDILENALSGVLLLLRQPFQSGDQIAVDGNEGTVEAITIRETRIKTYDGQMLVVPNRDVYKNAIRVQTHDEQRRIDFTVGVAYEADLADVRRTILEALDDVAEVKTDPSPEALVSNLNVSTVDIDVRCWVDSAQHEARIATDRAIRAVKTGLDDAGVEMPCDIVALQGTASLRAALEGREVTPSGSVGSSDNGSAGSSIEGASSSA